ncbi:excinuclease ABC subunit B, partial [Candidatus Roizmanbacteria bacterium CG09_land_8_20_14_0_10_41_9]
RSDLLDNLRKNAFDVLIGVNLLREGLDLPEVSLVAILDADKEGFLRSKTSLIQTMGRAARNISGEVILYADEHTDSIKDAVREIDRRRSVQEEYNKAHSITPRSIAKPVRERIANESDPYLAIDKKSTQYDEQFLRKLNPDALTPFDKKRLVKKLENEMRKQANDLHFELAIKLREKVRELKTIGPLNKL